MTHTNLTDTERGAIIATLHERGIIDIFSPRRGDYSKLARALGVHRSTARRDVMRVRAAMREFPRHMQAMADEMK